MRDGEGPDGSAPEGNAGENPDGDGSGDGPAGDPESRRQTRLPTRRAVLATLGVLGTGLAVGGALWDGGGLGGPESEGPRELVPASVTTHRAVESGRWDDPAVWDVGEVPGDGAGVLVESGVGVTLDHRESARHETVRVDGQLTVDPTVDTRRRVDTLVAAPERSLRVGTADEPVGPDATVRSTVADDGRVDES